MIWLRQAARSAGEAQMWPRGAGLKLVAQPGGRGPDAVAASLTRGLTALSLPFQLNPSRWGRAGTLGVLSDLDTLAQAIAWRRQVKGRRLLAGPNLVVLPSDAPSLFEAPEIDLCIVPSAWVKRLYERDTPALRGRIAVWAAGVDPARFEPAEPRDPGRRRALIYLKQLPGQHNVPDAEITLTQRTLVEEGFEVDLLSYGSFTQEQYRRALSQADVMVFFSPSESQCLALSEAWSADVPTLVKSCGRLRYRGQTFMSSSAPYLSRETGIEFDSVAALRALVGRWGELRASWAPRQWVLRHMTDAVCAKAYWSLAYPNDGHRRPERGAKPRNA